MAYLRLNKHYIHQHFILLGLVETLLIMLAALAIQHLQFLMLGTNPLSLDYPQGWLPSLVFSVILSACTLSMGVYLSLVREGFTSMALRTVVSFFLLGSLALIFVNIVAGGFIDSDLVFWGILVSTLLVIIVRLVFIALVDLANMRRRVVIFGAGGSALELIRALDGHSHKLGVHVVGCIPNGAGPSSVDKSLLIKAPGDWVAFVKQQEISEIVIAPDERRTEQGASIPLLALLDCKVAGVPSADVLSFCERELGYIDIDTLRPSWLLFSDGFKSSRREQVIKRIFDLGLSTMFFLIMWPFMLLTALAVKLESPGTVLYSQERVGLNGKTFKIYKFRSMRQDAEKGGQAVWASKNDARVTKVGAFIRNTRLDELPQLYNVIAGQMSFVGPRPERPEFVSQLEKDIPFYGARHKVKPGLMGWAQLKYPYGASVDDAKNKLKYDLYYAKNKSFFMDMLILVQTVEIILLGKGVH